MINELIYGFIYTRKFVYVALAGLLLAIGYFLSLTVFGDPRLIDNSLTFEEAHWWEIIIIFQGLILTFGLLFFSEYHCFNMARRRLWGVIIICCWPLAFLYGWLYYRRE
jgi:hypothetical protein